MQRTVDNPWSEPEEQEDIMPSEEDTVDHFPPVCPKCGATMIWDSDLMLTECGYIQEDEDNVYDENGVVVGDRVVHIFLCPSCDSTAEFEDLEDNGKMALLCFSDTDKDDQDSTNCEYSKYAQDKYGMPSNIA